MSRSRLGVAIAWLALLSPGCNEAANKESRNRSEVISSASQEMSGPSLFSPNALGPVLQSLRAKSGARALRLEIRARELTLQVEDARAPGTVVEYHYRDDKVSEPEHATLRGKGALEDNLFDLNAVAFGAISALVAEAVRRVDPEDGTVDLVLLRRSLPEHDAVRFRVYVTSPRGNGHLNADAQGQILD